jgi:hypothetical protein
MHQENDNRQRWNLHRFIKDPFTILDYQQELISRFPTDLFSSARTRRYFWSIVWINHHLVCTWVQKIKIQFGLKNINSHHDLEPACPWCRSRICLVSKREMAYGAEEFFKASFHSSFVNTIGTTVAGFCNLKWKWKTGAGTPRGPGGWCP